MTDPEKTEKQKARRTQLLLYALVVLLIAIPAVLYVLREHSQK